MPTFKVGDNIRYKRADKPERTCLGTIVKILPGFTERYQEAPHDLYTVEDCAIVEVMNPVPDWWAYPNSRQFAPDLTELEHHEENTP